MEQIPTQAGTREEVGQKDSGGTRVASALGWQLPKRVTKVYTKYKNTYYFNSLDDFQLRSKQKSYDLFKWIDYKHHFIAIIELI